MSNDRVEKVCENVAHGRIPHDFYKTGDSDSPDSILDGNGEVVLSACRACNQAESDLEEFCPIESTKETIEVIPSAFARSSIFARHIRDGKLKFLIESSYDFIKLGIRTGGDVHVIFAESNKLGSGSFEEARETIGEIVQAYGDRV